MATTAKSRSRTTSSGSTKSRSSKTSSSATKASKTANKASDEMKKGKAGSVSSAEKRSTRSAAPKRYKSKGVVDTVKSAVGSVFGSGESNVLDVLKEDHRTVDKLFQEIKKDEDASHKRVFNKVKKELDAHTHVEEVIFYPHLLKIGSEELQKIVREGVEEHAQVKTLLVELTDLDGDDEVFKAKLKVLMENVEHHVEEEEDEMFPLVEEEVERATLVTLADKVKKEKANFQRAEAEGKSTKRKKAQ